MPPDPNVNVGVAAFIVKDQQLALLKRSADASHGASTWAVPGGWIDYPEDPTETVVRETFEEMGVVVDNLKFMGYEANTYPDQKLHVVCLNFSCTLVHPELPLVNAEPHKADDVRWWNLMDLINPATRPALFPALENVVLRGGLHELFTRGS